MKLLPFRPTKMFNLYQSSDPNVLFRAFARNFYISDILSPNTVIVPNLTVGNDLKHKIASELGISWGVKLSFWTMFEWSVIESAFDTSQNYEFSSLGSASMQWKIFNFIRQPDAINSPIAPFLQTFLNETNPSISDRNNRRLWQFAAEMARIFGIYINTRRDWLHCWENLNFCEFRTLFKPEFQKKIDSLPDWLQQHYQQLYDAQRFLFVRFFLADFKKRENQVADFYQNIEKYADLLPENLWVYFPDVNGRNMNALKRIATVKNVHIFQYATTNHYIDDIVDAKFLRKKELLNQLDRNQHFDYGHYLYSRFAKIERERARILQNEELDIKIIEGENQQPRTILEALRQDMQDLTEENLSTLKVENDTSLRVFACHGLLRQLEVMRTQIALWLNEDSSRKLSDILIVFPDIPSNLATINAIFPTNGIYDQFRLPARVTAIADSQSENLWKSLLGFYQLEDCDFRQFSAWFLLPETSSVCDLNYEETQEILLLLKNAKFKRAFSETELQPHLHPNDRDFRFTFCYALDQICEDLLNGKIPLNKRYLVDKLCEIALIFQQHHQLKTTSLDVQIEQLLVFLQEKYTAPHLQDAVLDLTRNLKSLAYSLQRGLIANIDALPFSFILDFMAKSLSAKQTGGEPTGVITIGELKALKSIPYKLIIFANANQDTFPKIKRDERYNLCDLDAPRLGDRNVENDDLAEFLELFGFAREALWFFYTYIDPSDNEERLPCQPVDELLSYLKYLRPDLETYFYLKTPNSPLQLDNPAPLWRSVAENLQKPSAEFIEELETFRSHKINEQHFDLKTILYALKKPASHYLRQININLPSSNDPSPYIETLHLNSLENYQLRDYFYKNPDAINPYLPAGAARNAWEFYLEKTLKPRLENFLQRFSASEITPLTEKYIELNQNVKLLAEIPIDSKQWISLSAAKESGKHRLDAWIKHLAWSAAGANERSIWGFENSTLIFKALPKDEAIQEFLQLIDYYQNINPSQLPLEIYFQKNAIDKFKTALNGKGFFEDIDNWKYLLKNKNFSENFQVQEQRDFSNLYQKTIA